MTMDIRVQSILAAMAAFGTAAFAEQWYSNPQVQATVNVGYSNTGVHYMNLSEDGQYLMVYEEF